MKTKPKKRKAPKTPRPLALVRLVPDVLLSGNFPFRPICAYIFLGEIPNMPGHGIFIDLTFRVIHSGYHIDNFEEIPEDET